MPNKMLIDASHPEETRVVVVRGNRIEEFDFESQDKKQLRGNIYLARVTRVEPSLQAAFVEYGGNRHGFLAFSEIHPDYYQIPVADRQALLRAEAERARADDDDEDEDRSERRRSRSRERGRDRHHDDTKRAKPEEQSDNSDDNGGSVVELDELDTVETLGEATGSYHEDDEAGAPSDAPKEDDNGGDDSSGGRSMAAEIEGEVVSETLEQAADAAEDAEEVTVAEKPAGEDGDVESVGAEDALEEARQPRRSPRRQYKIQEVIKRRQILLVQVVKEERGNKGAALTTYLSLAGRYSVLMPNTARGGGISRKITDAQDRKRLKEVVKDLDVPEGMGVILRTAGESRTKAEIKRDYEYLMRLWDNVRNLTLESTAPALVYEEGSLIKRSVRDLYNKDIDEILVAGEDGYREAKDFMRMLMPSHARMVQPYRDTTPIFARSGLEAQLDRMVQPQVTLKSGGYIIINQTEALVAIDVNSGRSTKEHSIEDTALQTNLEAAEEVARQLRLRDLAGLIVIDFIDMEENRNNRAVEKRLKDHLKNDRARIQVGRISHFGLMEMSRQRIRASVLDSTMKPCAHCGGTGHVRSDSSVGLLVVRAIEEFLLKDSRCHLIVKTPSVTALYVLNHKRSTLLDLEKRFGVTISIEADETLGVQHYSITRGAVAEKPADFVEPASLPAPVYEPEPEDDIPDEVEDDEEEVSVEERETPADGDRHKNENGKRKRRRRRRGGRDRDGEARSDAPAQVSSEQAETAEDGDEGDGEADAVAASGEQAAGEHERKRRRRGRRGGKRNRQEDGVTADAAGDAISEDVAAPNADVAAAEAIEGVVEAPSVSEEQPSGAVEVIEEPVAAPKKTRVRKPRTAAAEPAEVAEKPARKPRASRAKTAPAAESVAAEPVAAEPVAEVAPVEPVVVPQPATEPVATAPVEPAVAEEETKPKKGGWWQRTKSLL